MQVVVDNLLVFYSRAGDGNKIILCLHGWADPSESFKKLTEALKDDYEFLMLDLPGFGGSQVPVNAWTIPDYAQFLESFLVKLKIKPYAVVGHSNGGAIGIYAVANKIINIQKLILLASSGVRNTSSSKKKLYKILAKPIKLALAPLPQSVQKNIKKKVYRQIGSDLYAAEHMRETFRNVVTYDIQTDAGSVDVPTLLIYGGQDKVTPPSYGQILAGKIKNSKLEIIDGASHFLHQEEPELIAKKISDFLE